MRRKKASKDGHGDRRCVWCGGVIRGRSVRTRHGKRVCWGCSGLKPSAPRKKERSYFEVRSEAS